MNRDQRERELEEEIQAHLRLAVQDRVRNGETPEQAAIAARREFGNPTLIKEVARDLWSWTWAERFTRTVSSAFRSLSRTPGSTATMILTLALGIGASTTIFSVVDAVLLRPLPYKDAGRLVAIWDREVHARGTSKLAAPYSDFDAYLHSSRSFEHIAAVTWGVDSKILTGRGEARSVRANPSTLDFFPLLGVSPAFGRTFVQQDLNRGCTVVLAYSFWQSVLGGQPGITGQRLDLDRESCTVIGVMPSGFAFYPESTSMWLLLTPDNAIVRDPAHQVAIFASLKPAISIAAAQAELRRLHRFAHEHDAHGAEMDPSVYPLQEELTGRNLRLTLLLLFAGVNLVLLIACFNVANLLLGRFVAREREFAVRAALGSSRGGLLLLLLTESLLVALSASLAGTALAATALRYFRVANPVDLPPGSTVGLNLHVLAFTIALVILTTLISGLVPAWRASSTNLNDTLKAAGRTSSLDVGRSRISKSFVVAEVTLSLLLLAEAGLMIESVLRFGSESLGLSAAGLMTIGIGLPPAAHADDARRLHFYEKVLGEVKSIPGVRAAAVSWELPVRSVQGITELSIDGRPKEHPGSIVPDVGLNAISPEYFPVTGIHIERGRNFGSFDREHSEPVAIVNEALVRKFFPNEEPLGKRVRAGEQEMNPWLTIVGVVGNERRSTAYDEMVWVDPPTLYRPLTQNVFDSVNLIFRCDVAQRAVVATEVRKRLAILDPGFPVGKIDTVQHLLAGYLAYPQFRAQLLTGFAGLALLLAVVGLYGLLAQTVTQRTREIGIRMALGAKRGDVVTAIAKQAMLLTATGVVLGLISVWGMTRFLKALLYGVSATDPATLVLVTMALLVSTVLAACMPARRATRVDPIISLRYE